MSDVPGLAKVKMSSIVAVMVATLSVAFLGYLTGGREDATVPTVEVDMSWVDQTPRLIEVDDTGAIVLGEGSTRGVLRDGTTAWQAAPDQAWWSQIICAESCPSAIASGDFEDFTADAAPIQWLKPSLPKGWEVSGEGANVVLAVGDGSALRVTSDAQGAATIESIVGVTRRDSPYSSSMLAWSQRDPSGRSGTLVSFVANAEGELPLAFARLTGSGWEVEDAHASRACISADGTRRVADDALVVKGRVLALPEAVAGQTCQFTRSGVLFGGRGGQAESLSGVGADGQLIWSRNVAPFTWATASESHDHVAFSTVTEMTAKVDIVDAQGVSVSSIPDAASGLFTEAGQLVTVSQSGQVTWHRNPS